MTEIPNTPPELIFELGALQVFHYPTKEDIENRVPQKIYWQDTKIRRVYGPFPSVYEAMTHRTWIISNERSTKALGKLISIDFKSKKRTYIGDNDV